MATTATPTNNPLTTQRGAAPLTTVFTTPDFCKELYWTDTITPPLSSVVCMPTSWKQVYDYQWGYYSPGICPSGYTEGCPFPTSLASSKDGAMRLGGSVIAGETARLCCPTGHVCYTGTDWAYSKCISTIPTTSYYDINNQPTSALATVYAVQVRWQASDLSSLETDPTVPGATYTGPRSTGGGSISGATATATGTVVIGTDGSVSTITPSVATATATSEGSGSGDSGGGRGGFSVGTTVAIAVGSVAGTLALVLVAFMIFWRRRKRRERSNSVDKPDSLSPPMLAAHKAGGSGRTSLDIMSPGTATSGSATMVAPHSPNPNASQLDSTNVVEMETMERPQELPEDYVIELEGDMPGPPLYREKEGWPLR